MELNQRFMKDLEISITDEEKIERGQILARKLGELQDNDAEKKKITKVFTDKKKTLETEIFALGAAIEHGVEKRPVMCSERADERRFQVETFRHDTGEIVDSRPMNADEADEYRQPALFSKSRIATEDKKKPDGPPVTGDAQAGDDAPKTMTVAVTTDENGGPSLAVIEGGGEPEKKPEGEETVVNASDDLMPETAVEGEITNPGGVLSGKVEKSEKPAKKSAKERAEAIRAKKKGLTSVDDATETPTTHVPPETDQVPAGELPSFVPSAETKALEGNEEPEDDSDDSGLFTDDDEEGGD